MAIFSSTLMTRGKGSVGNLTIVTSKGRMIAKQKISIMSNPRTSKQQLQRKGLSLAVALWKYLGGIIKSGITVYPQFGSQYNGFVNQNIGYLKTTDLDPFHLNNHALPGLVATNGNLGTINFVLDGAQEENGLFTFPVGALKNIAKIGDKVKVVIGVSNSSEIGYFEQDLTAADLLSTATGIAIAGDFSVYPANQVYAMWVESADGTKSTTSKFTLA